ncbi:hypothetical protein BDR22DRAFT_799469 [Usnea florida]
MANTIYASHDPPILDHQFAYSAPATSTRTDADLNLAVLQRYLPSTVSIDFLAPYAVIYIFNITAQAWERCGIEGSLFVVRLRDEGHAVVVLNRRGLDNFVLHLQSAGEVDLTEEYIILQGNGTNSVGTGNGSADEQKVYGLWIFEEEQGSTRGVRAACGKCISECAKNAGSKPETGVDVQSNGYEQKQHTAGGSSAPDLMALLNPGRDQDVNTSVVQQPDSSQNQDVLGDLFRKARANR